MTYSVKYYFSSFFGHPAPILRAIKVTLVNFDILKIFWMLFQVSMGVKYADKLIIALYIFKVSTFDSAKG